jgi:hypothetical protein
LRAWPRSTPISPSYQQPTRSIRDSFDRWASRPRDDIIHVDARMNDTDRGWTDTSDAGKVELRRFETSNYADGFELAFELIRAQSRGGERLYLVHMQNSRQPSSTAGFA